MDKNSLNEKMLELKKELVKVNAQIVIGAALKNPGQARKIKKTLAKILTIEKEKANKTEMKLLNILKENDKVFHIYNKLGFQGKVHSVDKIVIAATKFPLLTEEILVNRHNTIYNLFQNKFNVFITHTSERIKATSVDKKISQMLGIKMGMPILKIERLGYTFHDEIVELRTSYVNTTEVEYIRDQYSLVGE